jgi:hypothetical protein
MIPSLGPAEESGKAAGETEEVVERLTYLKERRNDSSTSEIHWRSGGVESGLKDRHG